MSTRCQTAFANPIPVTFSLAPMTGKFFSKDAAFQD